MPGFAVDSDGDVEMTVPQPIFELIRAPELRSWEHAALIEWHREWERYVEKIRHRCGVTNETFESVVATVKSSVRPKTLRNMATYVLKKPLSAVTDADIMEAMQARCRTLKNEFVPDVTSLFRQQLKMDLSIDDCDARIFRYCEDFNGIVEDNGLQGLIGTGNESDAGYKSRSKARCRLLVDGLQPPVLKDQITRLIDLEKRDCKSDDVDLFDLILEHAKSPAGSVRINGLVVVPYIPDTGADKSIIPQGIVDSLLAVLPTLTPTPLSTRVNVEMADGRRMLCEHEVLLNIELVTIAGPVSIRSVPCLILAGEGEEFLLGRDALKELGIDIDHQLAQLAGQPLLGAEEDEFPVGDGLLNEQDVHDPKEVIDRLVAQAVSEGLPANHVEAVRSVLTKYPDIWSEAIGPDPPAHVEPL
ncbi:unnamed protein product [Phytophthora fragariaefolia]|uniref:Unnamed protein product n=1 Tax=Phytophthora fragariaefolia TaxID=1490495 RepID=A0A9W6Y5C0_9STRA|nr:unnamed protein product [Phytophthora fragariaefolia]